MGLDLQVGEFAWLAKTAAAAFRALEKALRRRERPRRGSKRRRTARNRRRARRRGR